MSARTGVAPARRMALTEAKKLNGVVTTACPAQSRPQPSPATGRPCQRSSQPRGHAEFLRPPPLKSRNWLSKNELLRL